MSQSEVEVRMASLADADALERAGDAVFDHRVQRAWLADFFANPANLLAIALRDGEVVGMASGFAYAHPDKPRQLFVNEVGVAEAIQRRGVGARLVRTLLARGRGLGCTQAWVATEDDNRAARALYASVGGVEEVERAVLYVFPLGGASEGDPDVRPGDAACRMAPRLRGPTTQLPNGPWGRAVPARDPGRSPRGARVRGRGSARSSAR